MTGDARVNHFGDWYYSGGLPGRPLTYLSKFGREIAGECRETDVIQPACQIDPDLLARFTAQIAKGIILGQIAAGFMIDPGIEQGIFWRAGAAALEEVFIGGIIGKIASFGKTRAEQFKRFPRDQQKAGTDVIDGKEPTPIFARRGARANDVSRERACLADGVSAPEAIRSQNMFFSG